MDAAHIVWRKKKKPCTAPGTTENIQSNIRTTAEEPITKQDEAQHSTSCDPMLSVAWRMLDRRERNMVGRG